MRFPQVFSPHFHVLHAQIEVQIPLLGVRLFLFQILSTWTMNFCDLCGILGHVLLFPFTEVFSCLGLWVLRALISVTSSLRELGFRGVKNPFMRRNVFG